MEIKWHGNTCFKIKGKETTVLINPEKEMGKFKGEIVLSSLLSGLAEVEGSKKVFNWPGEFEVSAVPIIGYPAWEKSRSEGEDNSTVKPTIIFYFEIDKIKFCHLGELGHSLKSETIKDLGDVDILLIKAGENTNLTTKKAGEIIEAIDPRVIIPMGDNIQDFIKELNGNETEPLDKFTSTGSDLPENERILVRLNSISL